MWKKHEIIMLPTDKVERGINIFKIINRLSYRNIEEAAHVDEFSSSFKAWKPQHLYILSDDEIKEGEWCIKFGSIYKNGCVLHQYSTVDKAFNDITFKKIIATTDTSIILHENIENVPPIIKHGRYGNGPESQYKIPQIPESFIKEYCAKGGIDKVMIEYKYGKLGITEIGLKHGGEESGYKLKISEDNTIVIQLLKQNYTREEIHHIIDKKIKYLTGGEDMKSTSEFFTDNAVINELNKLKKEF